MIVSIKKFQNIRGNRKWKVILDPEAARALRAKDGDLLRKLGHKMSITEAEDLASEVGSVLKVPFVYSD